MHGNPKINLSKNNSLENVQVIRDYQTQKMVKQADTNPSQERNLKQTDRSKESSKEKAIQYMTENKGIIAPNQSQKHYQDIPSHKHDGIVLN